MLWLDAHASARRKDAQRGQTGMPEPAVAAQLDRHKCRGPAHGAQACRGVAGQPTGEAGWARGTASRLGTARHGMRSAARAARACAISPAAAKCTSAQSGASAP